MEQENDVPTPQDKDLIWPKGRKIIKRLPKFGSNRNPSTILGWKKYVNYQS